MEKVILEEFGNYSITRCGRLFSCKTGKELKWDTNRDGYYVKVFTLPCGKRTCRRRARLLAQTFIDNPDNLPIVNHIDHDRTNDKLENLEWVTHKENLQKSLELFPEKHKPRSTITYELAEEICKLIESGDNNTAICNTLNVSVDVVKAIRSKTSWTEVSCRYKMQRSSRVITDEVVVWVCERILEGFRNKEILSLSPYDFLANHHVKRIRAKKCHKHITEKLL